MTTDDPMESNRKVDAVAELLRQIGSAGGTETTWWNLTIYQELGNRTPTQAWVDGDHQAVEDLITKWYANSEAVARRYRENSDLMKSLQARSDALGVPA